MQNRVFSARGAFQPMEKPREVPIRIALPRRGIETATRPAAEFGIEDHCVQGDHP